MRPDLKKVICERERTGSRDYMGGNKGVEKDFRDRDSDSEYPTLDCLPSGESMTKRLGYSKRSFSENLGALRGLIVKNVGKNWDKLYSQICRQVSPTGSNIERHVHQHLPDFIYMQTRIGPESGKVEVMRFLRHWEPLDELRYSRLDYYVHPKTRCIVRMKASSGFKAQIRETRAEKERERQDVFRATSDPMIQLHRMNGLWWAITLERFDAASIDTKKTDLLVKDPWELHPSRYSYVTGGFTTATVRPSWKLKETYGIEGVIGVKRRILNKKELKLYGLVNRQEAA